MAVTKVWKLHTPTIAKLRPTAHYDWADEQSGTRIFEVFNKDTTGHNYTIVRITRDTATLCNEEFEGQCCDGYFENYPYDIKGYEMKTPNYKPQISVSLIRNLFGRVSESLNELEDTIYTLGGDEIQKYHCYLKRYVETFNAIASKDEIVSLQEDLDTIKSRDDEGLTYDQFIDLFEAVADAYYNWIEARKATLYMEDRFNSRRPTGTTEELTTNNERFITI